MLLKTDLRRFVMKNNILTKHLINCGMFTDRRHHGRQVEKDLDECAATVRSLLTSLEVVTLCPSHATWTCVSSSGIDSRQDSYEIADESVTSDDISITHANEMSPFFGGLLLFLLPTVLAAPSNQRAGWVDACAHALTCARSAAVVLNSQRHGGNFWSSRLGRSETPSLLRA